MDFNRFRTNSETLKIDLQHRALAAQEVSELLEYLRINPEITSLSLINTEITSDLIKIIADFLHLENLTSLDLSINSIGAAGAKDIANSPHLKKLTSLTLYSNRIGDAGATAFANSSKLTNLEFLDLSYNQIGVAGVELLSESLMNVSVQFEDALDIFYRHLVKIKDARDNGNKEVYVKDMIFNIAPTDRGENAIRHIITNPNKYPFLINSVDENGNRLDHFYNHVPNMQKFLFEHGLVPKEEDRQDRAMQNIAMGNQTVHDRAIVQKTNFLTKSLVKSIDSSKEELQQKAENYKNTILPNLFSNDRKQLNPLAIKLLDLTEADKKKCYGEDFR